ncbi:transglutaminase TgpA family protein [Pseudomonas sp. UBA4194]|uniref:transglutaminase TgpA family protein n=1 Tax=Pseudomonas sp. UBA4194 TaxID=1947317 RepID=UPI0025DBA576|nr:DUF3488 and DUF4129 domain-containing transglutaminase family protein [Pseudomonas sp. UBA4194]
MKPVLPIPRASLAWLLVAQALVLVPLWWHVPLWMLPLWLGCTLWRVQVFRMRAAYPGRLVKLLLMVGVAAGVYLSRGGLIGLDATAALLVAAFVLKVLEMQGARDARVVIFLGLFCLAVAYLFDASLPWALYSLLPLLALLSALIGLQQTALIAQPKATLKLALSLVGQALPLMVLLFVFFPRLEPLWSLPLPNAGQGVTGLSDSMSPADMANLGQSGEVAFRASFDGAMPAKRDLYWRALSLDAYDGRTWSQSAWVQAQPAPAWQPSGPALSYRIIQQPSARPWLFGLDVARTSLPGVRQLADWRLQRRRPVDQPLMYAVTSWPEVVREPELSPFGQRMALQLPAQGDPRTRQWAIDLKARFASADALVAEMLRQFRQQPFHYTLQPPTLGANAIDEFLFDSRRGFCAHYAGAMVFALRAAGVPARVVAGYQGGEINPAGNYLTVRQFDAHAWVEYWQGGTGWRSVDPTAAVAPARVEQGLQQALSEDENFLAGSPFSPLRYPGLTWLNEVRLQWDNLNYGWQRWVLGYQGETQVDFLERWFKGLQRLALPVGGVAVMVLLALWLLKPWQRRVDPQLKDFAQFERLLRRRGLVRETGEGAVAFAERAATHLPHQREAIMNFAYAFSAQRYAGRAVSREQMQTALRTLRRQLASAPPSRPSE